MEFDLYFIGKQCSRDTHENVYTFKRLYYFNVLIL